MPTLNRGLLANGTGRWFRQCDRCLCSSPTWPALDGLRVLAAAKAEGWRVVRGSGEYTLTCPTCVRRADRAQA